MVARPTVEHIRCEVAGRQIHLVGSIPGFVPDGLAVAALLDALKPTCVALGIPPEDLPALKVLAESDDPASLIPKTEKPQLDFGAGAPGLEGIHDLPDVPERDEDEDEGFASLDPLQDRLLQLLEQFGEVRLPSPDLEAAYRWAQAHDAAVQAIDLDDEAHAEVFVRANRIWDVVRNSLLQPKIMKATFDDAADAAELAIAFDRMQTKIPSLRIVEEAREAHMAERLRSLDAPTLVALVPLARLAGVQAALA